MDNKLAILEGAPVRDTYLSYGRQYIDDTDIAAVTKVLRSDFLTCGPKVPELEEKLCKIAGAEYCTAVSNGTTALHAACMAAGIGPGDEVIVTPITFAASANCVLYCGGTPIFADIDPLTWEISPAEIENKITPRTKAVITVDYTGQPCNYTVIKQICEKHNLILIDDAAHSIGTKYNGAPVGSIADMTTFSFHPVKTVTAGEGGAITTNSKKLYDRLQLFSKHGITHEKAALGTDDAWYYAQVELGGNFRITDIQCALLLSQLDKLEQFASRRKEITAFYQNAFSNTPEIILQREYPGSDTVRHLFVIRLNTAMLDADRKQIFDALRAENIGVNVHYIPVYFFPYYADMGYRKGICPQAERLYEEIITLPLFYAMQDGDAQDVVNAVEKVIKHYRKG